MNKDNENIIKGVWDFIKFGKKHELEQTKILQKKKEVEEFIKSNNQQTQLFNKQLDILNKQTIIQKQQASFNRIIALTGAILALISLLNFLKLEGISQLNQWGRLCITVFFGILIILLTTYIVLNMKHLQIKDNKYIELKPWQSFLIIIILLILIILFIYVLIKPFLINN